MGVLEVFIVLSVFGFIIFLIIVAVVWFLWSTVRGWLQCTDSDGIISCIIKAPVRLIAYITGKISGAVGDGIASSFGIDTTPRPDGTTCLLGSSCKYCTYTGTPNAYFDASKASAICGPEPPLYNGDKCLMGTSCNRCPGGVNWYDLSQNSAVCGTKPKIPDGGWCALGSTCGDCAAGTTTGETGWKNGLVGGVCGPKKYLASGACCYMGSSCGNCQYGDEYKMSCGMTSRACK